MENEPNYYAIIPANVRYSDISGNAKLLYGEITALSNKEGYCWASNKYFSDLYKVSTRSVCTWIKELSEEGFIYYEIEGLNTRKIFVKMEENFVGVGRKLPRGVGRKLPHNNTSINNTINKTPTVPLGDKTDLLEKYDFDGFWKMYPRNEGKKTAKAKFLTIIKNTAESKRLDLLEKICEGLYLNMEKYKKEKGNDFTFFPHATSWLNQERWNDYTE